MIKTKTLPLFGRTLQQLAHASELLLGKLLLIDEVRQQLDRRATINFVENASERGFAGLLGLDDGKVDVSLPLSAPVRHVTFHLERANHARDSRVRERRIDAVANLGDGRFAELPENTHYVQLALGQVKISHITGCGIESTARSSAIASAGIRNFWT